MKDQDMQRRATARPYSAIDVLEKRVEQQANRIRELEATNSDIAQLAASQKARADRLEAERDRYINRLAPSIEHGPDGIAVGYGDDAIDRLEAENQRLRNERDVVRHSHTELNKAYLEKIQECDRLREAIESERDAARDAGWSDAQQRIIELEAERDNLRADATIWKDKSGESFGKLKAAEVENQRLRDERDVVRQSHAEVNKAYLEKIQECDRLREALSNFVNKKSIEAAGYGVCGKCGGLIYPCPEIHKCNKTVLAALNTEKGNKGERLQ